VKLPLLGLRAQPDIAPQDSQHAQTPRAQADDGDEQPLLTGLRVLVVEDEADTRAMIQMILEGRDALVYVVASGDEALRAIEEWHPEVLVSDIGMPEMDGYQLMEKVRAAEATRGHSLPAMALTAYAREEDRERSIAAGYQRHLVKPVEPSDLITAVAELAAQRVTKS
jgi:CheY-like chemotaxis protein